MYNYNILPENLRHGMKLYIEEGIRPGSFLTACLANNLVQAVGGASSQTWDYIFSVCDFLWNELPAPAGENSPWGSHEAVKKYMENNQHL